MIVPLTEKYIKQVAAIHSSELPSSFLVGLGRDFLEKFYYKHVIQSPQAMGFVYLVDEQVAGFAIGATEANTFFNNVIRSYLFDLARVLCQSLCKKPSVLFSIWSAIGFILAQPQGYKTEPNDAEVITAAVLPRFRSPEFFRERRVKVASELVETVIERFKNVGVKRVKAFIDSSNFFAEVFYKNLGFRYLRSIEKYDVKFNLYLLELSN